MKQKEESSEEEEEMVEDVERKEKEPIDYIQTTKQT
jgi:hypothetical protein